MTYWHVQQTTPSSSGTAEDSCHIISGWKAKRKLAVGHYMFKYDGESNSGTVWWRCDHDGCKSRIHTINGHIVNRVNRPHTHLVVPGKVEAEELLGAMKQRAVTTSEPIEGIVQLFYAKAQCSFSILLPTIETAKKNLLIERKNEGLTFSLQQTVPIVTVKRPLQDMNNNIDYANSSNAFPKPMAGNAAASTKYNECDLCWRSYQFVNQLKFHKRVTHCVNKVPRRCASCHSLFSIKTDQGRWDICCKSNLKKYLIQRSLWQIR